MPKDPKRNPHPLAPTASAMNKLPIDKPRTAEVRKGSLIPKKSGKGGMEPATAVARPGVMRSGDNMGARRRIDIKLPGPQSPEAGATGSRGRTVRAVMGSKQNFWSQASQKW